MRIVLILIFSLALAIPVGAQYLTDTVFVHYPGVTYRSLMSSPRYKADFANGRLWLTPEDNCTSCPTWSVSSDDGDTWTSVEITYWDGSRYSDYHANADATSGKLHFIEGGKVNYHYVDAPGTSAINYGTPVELFGNTRAYGAVYAPTDDSVWVVARTSDNATYNQVIRYWVSDDGFASSSSGTVVNINTAFGATDGSEVRIGIHGMSDNSPLMTLFSFGDGFYAFRWNGSTWDQSAIRESSSYSTADRFFNTNIYEDSVIVLMYDDSADRIYAYHERGDSLTVTSLSGDPGGTRSNPVSCVKGDTLYVIYANSSVNETYMKRLYLSSWTIDADSVVVSDPAHSGGQGHTIRNADGLNYIPIFYNDNATSRIYFRQWIEAKAPAHWTAITSLPFNITSAHVGDTFYLADNRMSSTGNGINIGTGAHTFGIYLAPSDTLVFGTDGGGNDYGINTNAAAGTRARDFKIWGGGLVYADPTDSLAGNYDPNDTTAAGNTGIDIEGYRILVQGIRVEIPTGYQGYGMMIGGTNTWHVDIEDCYVYNGVESFGGRDAFTAAGIKIQNLRGLHINTTYTGDTADFYHVRVARCSLYAPHTPLHCYGYGRGINRWSLKYNTNDVDSVFDRNIVLVEPGSAYIRYWVYDYALNEATKGWIECDAETGAPISYVVDTNDNVPPLDSVWLNVHYTDWYGDRDSLYLGWSTIGEDIDGYIIFTISDTGYTDSAYLDPAVVIFDTNYVETDARNDMYTYPSGHPFNGIGNAYGISITYAGYGCRLRGNTVRSGTEFRGGEGLYFASSLTGFMNDSVIIEDNDIRVHQGPDMYYGDDMQANGWNFRQENFSRFIVRNNYTEVTTDSLSSTLHTGQNAAGMRWTPTDGVTTDVLFEGNHFRVHGPTECTGCDDADNVALALDVTYAGSAAGYDHAYVKNVLFTGNRWEASEAPVNGGWVNGGTPGGFRLGPNDTLAQYGADIYPDFATIKMGKGAWQSSNIEALDLVYETPCAFDDIDLSDPRDHSVKVLRSLNLYVRGNNGLPVVGATVTAENSYGQTVVSGLSASNGRVYDVVSYYFVAEATPDSLGFNPFTITASYGADETSESFTVGPLPAGGTDTLTLANTIGTGDWDDETPAPTPSLGKKLKFWKR